MRKWKKQKFEKPADDAIEGGGEKMSNLVQNGKLACSFSVHEP